MIAFAANLLAPLVVVTWVGFTRAASRAEALLIALIGAAAVAISWLQGPLWAAIGIFWPWLIVLALAVSVWRLVGRSAALPVFPARGLRSQKIIVPAVVFALLAVQAASVLAGRWTSEPAVALEWPLRGGSFLVIHGGSTASINHHHGVAAQKYAIDVVALNRFGFRASGLAPAELDRYVIFNEAVYAPCTGEVLSARDGVADGVPTEETSQLAGNYAAIYCNGATVLLAHFKSGTLAVKRGDVVRSGQIIGRVGSSGNSSEPHLHMHADAGRVDDAIVLVTTAKGMPMTFSGRFLARNDIVRS